VINIGIFVVNLQLSGIHLTISLDNCHGKGVSRSHTPNFTSAALEIWACVLDGVLRKKIVSPQCSVSMRLTRYCMGEGHIVIKRVVTSLAGW